MSTNFQEFNPHLNNAESDSAYTADPMRVDGAQVGQLLPSTLFNKVIHQSSMMTAALATALSNKGISTSDDDFPGLVSALSRIRTDVPTDTPPPPGSGSGSLPAIFGITTTGTVSNQYTYVYEGVACDDGPITRTLYDPNTHGGWTVTIKKIDYTPNKVTIMGEHEIDGVTTGYFLSNHGDFVTLLCDGWGWNIISQSAASGRILITTRTYMPPDREISTTGPWQHVYQNIGLSPMIVNVPLDSLTDAYNALAYSDGSNTPATEVCQAVNPTGHNGVTLTFLVEPGHYYSVFVQYGTPAIQGPNGWVEWSLSIG
jgi:hypothetical protein